MCGIAGGWSTRRFEALRDALPHMTTALSHRGPDDAGHWHDADAGVALGHRRLSIIDLSPQGHQPMVSGSGRYVTVYNGEIYNHLELRRALEAAGRMIAWRGHSDTETLLAAIDAWGLEETLKRCVGMFALALWDRQKREMWLARDRMGEKPLYYGWLKGSFIFASELSAVRSAPGFGGEIDRDALALFLRHGNVPAPHSIYQSIAKLGAGTLLCVQATDLDRECLPEPRPYWTVVEAYENGQANPFQGNDAEAIAGLETLLGNAVADMSLADVPLGAFLSGGIDSSTIVALMQRQSSRPVKTFTIGFEHAEYNEAEHAKKVAQHLGTEHTELYLTAAQVMAVVPEMPRVYAEPFADSSELPTFLVSRLARQHVTVSLSGDAGDELFYGYERYRLADHAVRKFGRVPAPLRKVASGLLKTMPVAGWNRLLGRHADNQAAHSRRGINGDRIHKFADLLSASGHDAFYRGLMTHWNDAERVVNGALEQPTVYSQMLSPSFRGSAERYMCKDLLGYLPDDILVKVDRAAMAVSLETRVPLLDLRIVEFALSLPLHFKYRNGQGKWLLRQVLNRYVPSELFDRPKMGFAIPLGDWLRGPLREWAESLLDESRLRNEGFFDAKAIRKKWREHLGGERDWQRHLWDILMFQAWHSHSAEVGVDKAA